MNEGDIVEGPEIPDEPEPLPPVREADRTGKDRLAFSILSSWGGYLVIVVASFFMPRFMDRFIGQTALGVWDFGWSLVSYFSLAQIGIGTSVNKFVAQQRATNDVAGLRRVVSSVTYVNLATSVLVLLVTAIATWAVPLILNPSLGVYIDVARWVVALLGLSLASQIAFDAFPGVVSGCHRWDLHNATSALGHVATVVATITALFMGGGLKTVAFINFVGVTATECARAVVAYRVCPELKIGWSYFDLNQAKQMFAFGAKSSLGGLSRLLLFQANNLVVAAHLGPGMLAVYARQMALVRIIETFANKFSFVLTPTASSLQGAGRHDEIRALVMKTTRFATGMILPLTLVLSILGAPIMQLWMGSRYQQPLVLAILAVGGFFSLTQRPLMGILAGLNLHGQAAVAALVGSIVGVGFGVLNVYVLHWGLVGAALAIALPLAFGSGIFIPVYACRKLNVSLSDYLRQSFLAPFLCAIPFAGVLIASRLVFAEKPLLALAFGFAFGGAVLAPLYWRFDVFPSRVKEMAEDAWAKVRARLRGRA